MLLNISKVEIKLEVDTIKLVAGRSQECNLTLTNLTDRTDDFDLSVEGVPKEWVNFFQNQVAIFPQSQAIAKLTVNVPTKAKPKQYPLRVIVKAHTQPGIEAEAVLTLEILNPLELAARLQPRRLEGYKVNYELVLRNRSNNECAAAFELKSNNCKGQFKPELLKLAATSSQTVTLTIQLLPKTPTEQARQLQTFEIEVKPTWRLETQTVEGVALQLEGEYQPGSRWVFVQQHPWLCTVTAGLVLCLLLWNWLILPTIQNGLLFMIKPQNVKYQDNTIRLEQTEITNNLWSQNPLFQFWEVKVRFQEEPDERVIITVKKFIFQSELRGCLYLAAPGKLTYKPETASQLKTFPWFLVPPDLVEKLDEPLQEKLQANNQKLTKIEVAGNTLFLRLGSNSPSVNNMPPCLKTS